MALPGREKTFALANCRDLLSKLDREIDRFAAAHADVEARIDLAFNIVVTAWHLCDWVFEDMTPIQRSNLKLAKVSDLQALARQECHALHLCRQAATASKHWKVTSFPDPGVSVIVTATPIEATTASPVPLYATPGWYLYFVDGTNTQAAEEVFSRAVGFWTHFIYGNEIAKERNDLRLD